MNVELKKIEIEDMQRLTHNREGEPYKTKKGDRFCLVKVTSAHDGIKYTAFDMNGWTKEWAVGKTIEAEAYQEEYEGTYSWKLRGPNKTRELEKRIEILEKAVYELTGGTFQPHAAPVLEVPVDNSSQEEKVESDLPWEQ